MNSEPEKSPRFGFFRNWLSLAGIVIALGGLFSFFLLFLLDSLSHFSNPYIGLLTYLVAPSFLFLGVVLSAGSVLWQRWRARKLNRAVPAFQIDLGRPRDRRTLGIFLGASTVFLFASAVLSYHTYHYTESVQFCGQACHTVMKPELVTYSHGPHARVACVECHIGPGAAWFVKAKISGTYQVYAVAFDKYPRPVPTPIKNLRPAQETCEQCHWPKKFVGNLDREYHYFLGDETNTPFTVRLTMKVGGGDPTHGPVGGIHWHMNVGNKVEYFATDDARQKIPWVRVTDDKGVVTEYRMKNFTNAVAASATRTMDCMDCHNRPAHTYQTPDDAVNLAISLGHIDRSLPWIKTNAVFALTRHYTNENQARQGIATFLAERYSDDRFPNQQEAVSKAIRAAQEIYVQNFFPEMNASWEKYPNNIGHKNWPGCFRCHDGQHKTADGRRAIKANDCNACHTILAQGSGAELQTLSPNGQKFKHPGDEVDNSCNDCHTGGP
jgi:nitrate/TMAO reductase-like tetraheme cytochrome c subunit